VNFVADTYEYVIGVDTHAKTHTYAVVAASTGVLIDTETFPTTAAGMARAITWIGRRAAGERLAAVEGTSSYGATLTRALTAAGIPVCEVKPPGRQSRDGRGKTDQIDAAAAARTALGTDATALILPRADGLRSALRVLLVARRGMDTQRTADRNALTALLRTIDLGLDVRTALTNTQIDTIAAWRDRTGDDVTVAVARSEARRLATAIRHRTVALDTNQVALSTHVDELAPGIRDLSGVGPFTAAIILTAYSHRGRVRSEAAFAAMAGVSPIPASSGNTSRHRLNRHGDRQLNRAIHIIARSRMMTDATTKAYIERRTNEGKTRREIHRCLKRFIARSIYRSFTTLIT